MRFYLRRRRQAPAVIIVALIDILIVLLIFLMVTTTFKQQPALKLALPESSQALKTGATDSPPLIVSIDQKGILFLGSDKKAMTLETFKTELSTAAQKDSGLRLGINADEQAPLVSLVKVMDAAKEAKVKTSFLYTKPSAQP